MAVAAPALVGGDLPRGKTLVSQLAEPPTEAKTLLDELSCPLKL